MMNKSAEIFWFVICDVMDLLEAFQAARWVLLLLLSCSV